MMSAQTQSFLWDSTQTEVEHKIYFEKKKYVSFFCKKEICILIATIVSFSNYFLR